MRPFRVVVLLFALLLLQPACKKKAPDTPGTGPTPPVSEVVKEKKDVIICITKEEADIREAHVKAGKKQSFAWKAHDAKYVIRFADDQWGFVEAPDRTETGYKLVDVPMGGNSNLYTLDYELSAGATKEHHYRIETDPPGPPPPPNGPAIVGGD